MLREVKERGRPPEQHEKEKCKTEPKNSWESYFISSYNLNFVCYLSAVI